MKINAKNIVILIFGIFIFKIAIADTLRGPTNTKVQVSGNSIVIE